MYRLYSPESCKYEQLWEDHSVVACVILVSFKDHRTTEEASIVDLIPIVAVHTVEDSVLCDIFISSFISHGDNTTGPVRISEINLDISICVVFCTHPGRSAVETNLSRTGVRPG